jgi:hypothetical protein
MLSYIKQLITSTNSSSSSSSRGRPPGVLVITLHQPGMELTSLLDDLLLLAPGGRCVYAGHWAGALPYFQGRLGLAPPPHTGLAEWFLSLLTAQGHPGNTTSSSSSSSQFSLDWECGQASSSSPQQAAVVDLHAAWQAFTAQGSSAGAHDVQSDARQSAGAKQLQGQGSLTVISVVVDSDGEEAEDGAGLEAAQPSQVTEAGEAHQAERAVPALQEHSQADSHRHGCSHSTGSSIGHTLALPDTTETAHQWQQYSQAAVHAGSSSAGAGFWVQAWVLALRSLRWWWRNPAMILSGGRLCG